MPSLKVLKVKELGRGEGQAGPWSRHKLRLEIPGGGVQDATIFVNRGRQIPVIGDVLEGTIEPPKQEGWSPEFKPARAPGGGRPAGRPPEERRAIAMQSSHKVAVDIVRLAYETGKETSGVRELVQTVAEQIYNQVQHAEKDTPA